MGRRAWNPLWWVPLAAALTIGGCSSDSTDSAKATTTTTASTTTAAASTTAEATTTTGERETTTTEKKASGVGDACALVTPEELHSLSPNAGTGKIRLQNTLIGTQGCEWWISDSEVFVTFEAGKVGSSIAPLEISTLTSPYQPYAGVGDSAKLGTNPAENAFSLAAAQEDYVVRLEVDKNPTMTAEQVAAVTQKVLDRLTA